MRHDCFYTHFQVDTGGKTLNLTLNLLKSTVKFAMTRVKRNIGKNKTRISGTMHQNFRSRKGRSISFRRNHCLKIIVCSCKLLANNVTFRAVVLCQS